MCVQKHLVLTNLRLLGYGIQIVKLIIIGHVRCFLFCFLVVSFVREFFGSGAFSLRGMGQVKFLTQDWFISSGGLYENNNLMILPPMALVVVGVIIWIQRSRNEALIED